MKLVLAVAAASVLAAFAAGGAAATRPKTVSADRLTPHPISEYAYGSIRPRPISEYRLLRSRPAA